MAAPPPDRPLTRATTRQRQWLAAAVVLLSCSPPAYVWPDSGSVEPPFQDAGVVKDCRDLDGDGYRGTGDCSDLTAAQRDCDDADPATNPGLTEVCDGLDNNCNASIDEGLAVKTWFVDGDGDGYGGGAPEVTCKASIPGKVTQAGDCDDTDPQVHPGAPEFCNDQDDDCNGKVDDNVSSRDYFTDADNDGFGTGSPTPSCQAWVPGKSPVAGDCNDADPEVHPGLTEQCNGKDDDCNGKIDESFPAKGVACLTGEPGVCLPGTRQCVAGFPVPAGTCVRTTQPSPERCDGLDNDCSGLADEAFPLKGTSCTVALGVCARSAIWACGLDGGLNCPVDAGPPTPAACDGLDNDCNGEVDEFVVGKTWPIAALDPPALDLAPLYLTPSSCNGGNNTTGVDSWVDYLAAYVSGSELYVQQLRGDGAAVVDGGTSAPLLVSAGNSGYQDVAIAQGGPGMLIAAPYYALHIDLFYVGPGPILRSLEGSPKWTLISVLSPATVSGVRVVRGNRGRAMVLWREGNGAGASDLRLARLRFTGAGTAWNPVVETAPMTLPGIAGSSGPFAVASNVPEFGDSVSCPAGLAKLAVAYKVGETLKLSVFNEDGTAAGAATPLYTGSAGDSVHDVDVAWSGQLAAGADRWGAIFSVGWTATANAALYVWQSGKPATVFGGFHGGGATNSLALPMVVGRPSEFLLSALVYESATLTTEPQIYVGKVDLDGGVALPLSAATAYGGCVTSGCVNGTRTVAIPASSSGGPYKSPGFVLYGGSSANVNATGIGCN